MNENIPYEEAERDLYLYPMSETDKDEAGNCLLPGMLKKYASVCKRYIFFFLICRGSLVTHEMMRGWMQEGITPEEAFFEAELNTAEPRFLYSWQEFHIRSKSFPDVRFYKIGFESHAAMQFLFGSALSFSEEVQADIMEMIGDYYLFYHDRDSFYITPMDDFDETGLDPMACFDRLISDIDSDPSYATGYAPHFVNQVFICGKDGNAEYYMYPVHDKKALQKIDDNEESDSTLVCMKGYEEAFGNCMKALKLYLACQFLYQTDFSSKTIAESTDLPIEEVQGMEQAVRGIGVPFGGGA